MFKVALVGRANVGKSTLFNALTRSRAAIVSETPGLTRDRHYGVVRRGARALLLADTGGIAGEDGAVAESVEAQARCAVAEADLVCFVVSAAEGLTPGDQSLAADLRKRGKPPWLIVNKSDGRERGALAGEFAALGVTPAFYTSARRASCGGVASLARQLFAHGGEACAAAADEQRVRVTFLGRPNAGKSTLINRLLRDQRLITCDEPGTTRDAIAAPFSFRGRALTLVDTAGVRRRARIGGDVEKISVLKTLESVYAAGVAVLICDAGVGVTDQDANLAARVVGHGRALVVALNKWDLVAAADAAEVRRGVDTRLRFVDYVEVRRVSALRGDGVAGLLRAAVSAWDQAAVRVPTPECNRLLQAALARHPPPATRGAVKLRYMCQGGSHPPHFVIHGSRVERLSPDYKRYLASYLRRQLRLTGTPVSLEFHATPNPYAPRARRA